MALEPNWSAEEDAVLARYVAALKAGRYRSGASAARACLSELNARRRRLGSAGPRWPHRTSNAVVVRLGPLKQAAGITAPHNRWQPEELAVARRHVALLARGRYPDLQLAGRACRAELEARRRARPGPGPRLLGRNLCAVRQKLAALATAEGVVWTFHHWRPGELRQAERFARAYLAGRYASVRAAARACWQVLARSANRPRQLFGVVWHVYEAAKRLGMKRVKRPWSRAQDRILNRYVRYVVEGRYASIRRAAQDCWRALGRSHTFKGVKFRLMTEATRTGIPRRHSDVSPVEMKLVERYALKVHRGELPHWLEAARQCREEVRRRYLSRARSGPLRAGRVHGHVLQTFHAAVMKLARERNLRGPRNPHWTEAELRFVPPWVRWYDRYRGVRRLRPMKQAAEGLQDELAEAGFERKLSGCENQIILLWRRQHGLP